MDYEDERNEISRSKDNNFEWQSWIMIVGICHLLVFLLTLSETWNDKRMISDNLLHPNMPYYVWTMTVFTLFQCLVYILYINRFKKKDLATCIAGWGFVAISGTGWLVLAFNADARTHLSGVILYVLCLGATIIVCIRLSKLYEKQFEPDYYDLIAGITFVASLFLLIAFGIMYLVDYENSWLFENLAYLLYLLFYLYFFSNHPFDPATILISSKPYLEVPVCRPLLIIKRT